MVSCSNDVQLAKLVGNQVCCVAPLKCVHFAYSYYSFFLFGFYIRNVFVSILERLMSRQGLDPTDDVLMAFFPN